jgi:hypothetical protein
VGEEGAEGGEEEVGVDRGRLLLEEGEGSASLWGNQAGSFPNSELGPWEVFGSGSGYSNMNFSRLWIRIKTWL